MSFGQTPRITTWLIGGAIAGCLVASLGAGSAWAAEALPMDRQYKLGEDGLENGSVGALVGVEIGGSGQFFTYDSVGVSSSPPGHFGSFQDLERFGNPVYADVSNRPLYTTGVGIAFDGNGDSLKGSNLNNPANSRGSIGHDDTPGDAPHAPGPNNYNGISNRFFQFWVKPDATDAADPNKTQSLVMDSNQHGVQIVDGTWSMRFGGTDYDSGVSVVSTVDANGWAHVMLARPFGSSGSRSGSQLYVNGVAVIAASGGYNGGAHEELVLGSNTSRDGDNEFNGGTQDFFHGVIDNLTMTLIGDNTGNAGPPQGMIDHEFDLYTDNEWIANEVLTTGLKAGDVNRDGEVNGDGSGAVEEDDVSAFVAGWLMENRLGSNSTVGDWLTWEDGDMNYDGITELDDAFILHEALLDAGGTGLNFDLLTGAVPEPSSLALIALAAMAFLPIRRQT